MKMSRVEEEITSCTHEILRGEDGKIVFDDRDNISIKNISDGNIILVPVCKEIASVYGFRVMEEILQQQRVNQQKTKNPESETFSKWSRNATLALIGLCSKYEHQFVSSTIKNDKVYENIKQELWKQGYRYSAVQCKDKYKYLKMRYLKKKDNMKRTGQATFHFEFFDEMEELLGKKPNVEPLSIASSSRLISGSDTDDTRDDILEEVEESTPTKKRKIESKESAIERRHREKLEIQKAAIKSFETVMTKLLEKL